ncbi:hypothetical protein Tco_0055302, partial [Tanacetum coccineum]
MVLKAVLMKPGLVSIYTARKNDTARQVNTGHSKTIVNAARPMSYISKTAHSTIKRPIHKNTTFKNSNINQKVNTARDKKINTAMPKAVVKGNNFNVVKALACWGNPQMNLQDQRVIDSGCSWHMTENMSYLTDYEELDGGYVAFGGNPKGGKITGKESYPLRKDSECNDQEKEDNVNNTNTVNTASTNEVNVVGGKTIIELSFNPNMPALEDDSIFVFTRDDKDDGVVADINNLDTTIQ